MNELNFPSRFVILGFKSELIINIGNL